MAKPNRPTTIDEYIQSAPELGRPYLIRLYALLKKVAPEAQEVLKWGTPFFIEPRFLFAFSAHKAHLNFIVGPRGLKPFHKKLKAYKTTQGSLQIHYGNPMPEALIYQIAESRLRDVRESKDTAFW